MYKIRYLLGIEIWTTCSVRATTAFVGPMHFRPCLCLDLSRLPLCALAPWQLNSCSVTLELSLAVVYTCIRLCMHGCHARPKTTSDTLKSSTTMILIGFS